MGRKEELVAYLKTAVHLPIAGMDKFPLGGFNDLEQQFGTTDFTTLPGNPQYQQLVREGLILGYNEQRKYNGMPFGQHWGIDILSPAGTPVTAALGGTVIDTRTISDRRPEFFNFSYGNHVVLATKYNNWPIFMLYAHLGDLEHRFVPGQGVVRGGSLGVIGEGFTHENGGWPPHLHFQVATSVFGISAYAADLEALTINPEEIFGIRPKS
ncbi:MAG: peptidoglycan DD-metalloendopeptidase family protein [Nanoarchaeota archaeon]